MDAHKIPASIMELAHLEVLLLEDCGLTGTLGWPFVQFLKTLKQYSLRKNQLIHLEVHVRMANSPSSNDISVFNHFPCYHGWSSQQDSGANIGHYHDALYKHVDEIKFRRQHPEDAFAVFKHLAHLGHVPGMYSYGYSIMFGQGTPVDRTGGFACVENSATLGFAHAQRQLATWNRDGVAVNLFKAVDYYRMAVRLKHDGAKSCLGPD
ncbi:hypothetical protein BJ741DRAFT_706267 [Chytriomyces cf. hyalinus JEL632]|nr:hypothetical protein BJ741DRAFT_706267 [Chytriomyces cf. hyalinus JEL632]